MIKNFHYRFLLVATFITGCLFIYSVPEASNKCSWIAFGCTFFFLYWVTYKIFKGLSRERINEILFADTLKRFNIDIDEE